MASATTCRSMAPCSMTAARSTPSHSSAWAHSVSRVRHGGFVLSFAATFFTDTFESQRESAGVRHVEHVLGFLTVHPLCRQLAKGICMHAHCWSHWRSARERARVRRERRPVALANVQTCRQRSGCRTYDRARPRRRSAPMRMKCTRPDSDRACSSVRTARCSPPRTSCRPRMQ